MIDIPDEAITKGTPIAPIEIQQCIEKSASKHSVDQTLLQIIIETENGKKGTVRYNKSNGSHDLGPAQINTIQFEENWFQKEYPNVTWQNLSSDVCLNIDVAGRVFKQRISELKPSQSIWNAVGNYHSKTHKYKLRYLQKVMKAYRVRAQEQGEGYRVSWLK